MQVHRIDTELELQLAADTSCSVFWLIPEADRGELTATMAAVLSGTRRKAWGFLGSWDETKKLKAYSGHINASARLPASLSIGDTRLVANALDLGSGGGWFWPLFGGGTRPHEICAGLVPADAGFPAGWMHAALLLVLEQASAQARPGRASERYTLHAHVHAFIA